MRTTTSEVRALPAKRRSIAALIAAQVLALAPWFSGSAVLPALRAEVAMSDLHATALTSAVQAGFVMGALVSAVLGLADRFEPRRFFMAAAVTAALCNAALLWVDPASPWALVFRLATGAAMAGIYPVGMKLAAGWAQYRAKGGDLGLLVGLLVGALALGSASPHLFKALGGVDWLVTIAPTPLRAMAAAAVIRLADIGPATAPPRRFVPGAVALVWQDRPLRLVTLGYLGHMWEVYALWAWLAIFLDASFRFHMAAPAAGFWAAIATFAAIGLGAVGCVLAGFAADRIGRTAVTTLALGISGACALLAGFSFGAAPALTVVLCVVWGTSAIADSAQFSAATTELSAPEYVGTMLTIQTCAGFLLTLVSIHLLPLFAAALGWHLAPAVLAIGPVVGIWAMLALRRRPEAVRLAHGRR
jgi:MFS family permease